MEIDKLFEGIKEMATYAKKELGQNYLIDKDICKKIVTLLNIKNTDNVLEIGSGYGALSIFLLDENFKTLTLNDVDQGSLEFLNSLKESKHNTFVENKSGLKIDLNKYSKIISNLPYYITNDLLERCLVKGNAERYVFMVQKEVYNRLIAKVNEEEYGPLAIIISLTSEIKKEMIISRDSFLPKPHVDSLVFSIDQRNKLAIDKYDFLLFLKKMFLHRRKTIFNNLTLYLKNKDQAKNILNDLTISILMRPEQITPEQYLNIYKKSL